VSGELIVMVVLGGMGSVFGPLLGALLYLGLEEVLKAVTEHWMAVFGPLIVLMALLGKRGAIGFLQKLDPALPAAPPAASSAAVAATGTAAVQGGMQ
jgi:branched-chain amino acid transport system permease protein